MRRRMDRGRERSREKEKWTEGVREGRGWEGVEIDA